jgi:hypothetical protein
MLKARAASSASLAAMSSCQDGRDRGFGGPLTHIKDGHVQWPPLRKAIPVCTSRVKRHSSAAPSPTSASRSSSISFRSRRPSAAASSSSSSSRRAGVDAAARGPRTQARKFGAITAPVKRLDGWPGGGAAHSRGQHAGEATARACPTPHVAAILLFAASAADTDYRPWCAPGVVSGVPPVAAPTAAASTASIMWAHSCGVKSPSPAAEQPNPTVAHGVRSCVASWSLRGGARRAAAGVDTSPPAPAARAVGGGIVRLPSAPLPADPGARCTGGALSGAAACTSRRHLVGLQSPCVRMEGAHAACRGPGGRWALCGTVHCRRRLCGEAARSPSHPGETALPWYHKA